MQRRGGNVSDGMGIWRRFWHDEQGGIAIMSVLLLPVAIGFAALVGEYGNGLINKAENQRVADLAAYAGALAYTRTGNTGDMTGAANYIAQLNGIAPSAVSASLIPSPSGEGEAVSVTISTEEPLLLATILGADRSITIRANAIAEFASAGDPAACLIALNGGGTGLTLSGGTSLSADDCAVASNASISVPCGTFLTAKDITYNSANPPSAPCNGIRGPGNTEPKITKGAAEDPLAAHAAVTAATGRFAGVAALTAPAAPMVPTGTDIEFGWNQSATVNAANTIGCTATWASPKWTLTCPRGRTYNFGALTMGGGITLEVKLSGSGAAPTFNFSGEVSLTAAAATFPEGNYNFARGINTSGSMIATFGAGTYRMGRSSTWCGSGQVSVCQNGDTLRIEGPSTFEISSGVYTRGGGVLVLGTGSGNSFRIGPSSSGHAVDMGGGAKTSFGDATPDGVFQLIGNLNMESGGGSCLTIGAAADHDIAGYFSAAGGIRLGAGRYTIDGYMALGLTGGGNVHCDGETIGVVAHDVSIVISAKTTPSTWSSCNGAAFCVGAGYSNVVITAPTSGEMAGFAVIGPQTNSAGAAITEGGGARISGAFYFPNGPVTMSGGASAASGPGDCLQIIAEEITLSGGAKGISACVATGGATGGGGGAEVVRLVR